MMQAITLRNLPPELARRIRRHAEERGISLNRAVIDLLQGSRKPVETHDDLDALFGAWSARDAAAFERSLAAQRRIDPEIWR